VLESTGNFQQILIEFSLFCNTCIRTWESVSEVLYTFFIINKRNDLRFASTCVFVRGHLVVFFECSNIIFRDELHMNFNMIEACECSDFKGYSIGVVIASLIVFRIM